MRAILLGPQRRPTLDAVVRGFPDGPFATVTAGWQEREPDDGELRALLGGRGVGLELYRRWLDVQERDPEYAAAERGLQGVLGELADLYLLRLDYALQAVYALQRRTSGSALAEAVAAVRSLDAAHLAHVNEVRGEFFDRLRPHDRPVIAAHRSAVAGLLGAAAALGRGGRARGRAGRGAAPVQRGGGAAVAGDRVVRGRDGAGGPDRAVR